MALEPSTLTRCADLLAAIGITAAVNRVSPIGGGVSSDLFRVDLAQTTLCVKFACPRLRVAADWRAPVARSGTEYAWLNLVGEQLPHAVPRTFGHDPVRQGFAMAYLPPEDHPSWKSRLLEGQVDVAFAGHVGSRLGTIHAITAGDNRVRDRFATQANFRALRLQPYLEAAAERNAAAADRLHALARSLDAARVALVHGDVSPKNILCGPAGPVIVDAECAVYGDPAFDPAFCLTHLVAKAIHLPSRRDAFAAAAVALWQAYFATIDWEEPAGVEARVAALLPGIVLARVDGKSPLEYLADDHAALLRERALAALARSSVHLDEVLAALTEVQG